MFGITLFLNCMPARTRRGERPVKMRHPQSSSSTDVMEGSSVQTQPNNTTTSSVTPNFFNPNRHQNTIQKCRTVEWWLGFAILYVSSSRIFPLRREGENRAGHHRMRDHEGSVSLFNFHNRIEKGVLHERTSAGRRFDLGRPRRKPARADRTSSHPGAYSLGQMIAPVTECCL